MSIRKYVLLFVVAAAFLAGRQGERTAGAATSDKWDLWSDSTPTGHDARRAEKPTEHPVMPPDTPLAVVEKGQADTTHQPVETPASGSMETSPYRQETAPGAPQTAEGAEKPSEQAQHPANVQATEPPNAADEKTSREGSAENVGGEQKKTAGKVGGEDSVPANSPADTKDVMGESYIIGPGDLLDISVWKDDALTRIVVVLPDGKINFPLVGEVVAAGKTVGRIKEELAGKLSDYVPELVLNVEVKQSNSMFVYVIGRVNQPGKQVLNSSVTVLQALAMAGGPNPFASRNKIKVFRKEGDKTVIHPFHYNDVVSGEDLETNIALQRGDVIVVP